jgi:hypothetical protein
LWPGAKRLAEQSALTLAHVVVDDIDTDRGNPLDLPLPLLDSDAW